MKTLTLAAAVLSCALAAGAQPSSGTVEGSTTTATTAGDTTARGEVCERGCMAHHDSSELACKMFKRADETSSCLRSAQEKRLDCERECVRRHPPKGRSGEAPASQPPPRR